MIWWIPIIYEAINVNQDVYLTLELPEISSLNVFLKTGQEA